MKERKVVIFGLILLSLYSCKGADDSKTTAPETRAIAKTDYPFVYIDKKIETRKMDDSYNEMTLYSCGIAPNKETLKLFCSEKKNSFVDGVFHFIVFFDEKRFSKFPNNPVTALYMEDKPMKHIKAIYSFNRLNGYSKLEIYEKNAFESSSTEIQIN